MKFIFRASRVLIRYASLILVLCSLTSLVTAVASSEKPASFKDPTRPLQYSANAGQTTAEEKLLLQAVFLGAGSRFAIINGEQLSAGQEINGWRVHKIQTNQVELNAGDRWKTLQLLESIRK